MQPAQGRGAIKRSSEPTALSSRRSKPTIFVCPARADRQLNFVAKSHIMSDTVVSQRSPTQPFTANIEPAVNSPPAKPRNKTAFPFRVTFCIDEMEMNALVLARQMFRMNNSTLFRFSWDAFCRQHNLFPQMPINNGGK